MAPLVKEFKDNPTSHIYSSYTFLKSFGNKYFGQEFFFTNKVIEILIAYVEAMPIIQLECELGIII